ncbi:unnamed protein product [Ectocarpus sp. 12 AP-2014]
MIGEIGHDGGLIGLDGNSLDGVGGGGGGGGGGLLPAVQAVTNGDGLNESTWLSLGGGPVGNGVVTVTGAEVDRPGADLVIDAGARDGGGGGDAGDVGAVAGGVDGGGVVAAGQHPVPGGRAPHDVGGGEGGGGVGLGGHGVEEDDHLGLMKAAAEQSSAEQKQADEELVEAEQSLRLRQLVEERQLVVGTSGAKDWTNIARKIPPKTDLQCMLHWNHVINPELTKGKGSWKQEEDERIIQLVEHHGKKWSVIASQLKAENGKMTRVGKQIRERYLHHLDPNLKKGDWSVEEEEILVREHGVHKNKWAQIAKSLPGRCSNDIKNHWYAHERRQREISRASTSSTAAAAATETPPIVVQRTARPFPVSANPYLARILPAPPPRRQALSETEDGGEHHHSGGVGGVLLERPQESTTAPGGPGDGHFLGGGVVDDGGAPEHHEESVEVEDRHGDGSIDDGLLLQQPAGDYDPTHVAGSGSDGGHGGGSGGGGDGGIDDHDHGDMMMMIMASHAMPLPPPPAPAAAPAPTPGTDAGGVMVGPVATAEEEVDPGQDFGLPLAKRARIDGGDDGGGGGGGGGDGDQGGEGHQMLIDGSGIGSAGVSDVEDENTVADSFVGSGFGSDEHPAVDAGGGGSGGDGGRIDDDVVGAGSGVMDHFGATEIGGGDDGGGGLERFGDAGTIGDGDLERFEPAEATGDVDNGGGSPSAAARLEEHHRHHGGIGSDGEGSHDGVDGGDADCVFPGWDRLRNDDPKMH